MSAHFTGGVRASYAAPAPIPRDCHGTGPKPLASEKPRTYDEVGTAHAADRRRPTRPGTTARTDKQIRGDPMSERIAIVTGAARGIGAGTAVRLAADGM